MPTEILNHNDVNYKLRRIAHQIAEDFWKEDKIILAGIMKSGYAIVEKLATELEDIFKGDIILCQVEVNKKEPVQPIYLNLEEDQYRNSNVIVCDDVLNSGATLIYAVRKFLSVPLKQLKTAVLIDRSHKRYPIKADFKGLSLSTNLDDHVNVHLENKDAYSVTLG